MALEITVAEWMKLAVRMLEKLDRADLTSRQRRAMQFLVEATLMRGRQRVRVPHLKAMEDVLGVTQLSLVLRQLAKMRLLQIVPLAEGGAEYVLLPDSTYWDVDWLYDQAAWMKLMRKLDAYAKSE